MRTLLDRCLKNILEGGEGFGEVLREWRRADFEIMESNLRWRIEFDKDFEDLKGGRSVPEQEAASVGERRRRGRLFCRAESLLGEGREEEELVEVPA